MLFWPTIGTETGDGRKTFVSVLAFLYFCQTLGCCWQGFCHDHDEGWGLVLYVVVILHCKDVRAQERVSAVFRFFPVTWRIWKSYFIRWRWNWRIRGGSSSRIFLLKSGTLAAYNKSWCEIHSTEVVGEVLTSPSHCQCLLFDLCMPMFCWCHRSRLGMHSAVTVDWLIFGKWQFPDGKRMRLHT